MDLRTYLADAKIEPPAFAAEIGVTAASVYRYLARDRRPKMDVMLRIAKATNNKVQPNDFFATQQPDQAA